MSANAKQLTRADVDQALHRVEQGESDSDDANLLRAYLLMLEGRVRVLQLADDQVGEEAIQWAQ